MRVARCHLHRWPRCWARRRSSFGSTTRTSARVLWSATSGGWVRGHTQTAQYPVFVPYLAPPGCHARRITGAESCSHRVRTCVSPHHSHAGFTNVYNRNEDFYAVVERGGVPEHDVLVTNPPYSADHMQRCLRFCMANGAPRSPKRSARLRGRPCCGVGCDCTLWELRRVKSRREAVAAAAAQLRVPEEGLPVHPRRSARLTRRSAPSAPSTERARDRPPFSQNRHSACGHRRTLCHSTSALRSATSTTPRAVRTPRRRRVRSIRSGIASWSRSARRRKSSRRGLRRASQPQHTALHACEQLRSQWLTRFSVLCGFRRCVFFRQNKYAKVSGCRMALTPADLPEDVVPVRCGKYPSLRAWRGRISD